MIKLIKEKIKNTSPKHFLALKVACLGILIFSSVFILGSSNLFSIKYSASVAEADKTTEVPLVSVPTPGVLDSVAYNLKLIENANNPIPPPPKPVVVKVSNPATNPKIPVKAVTTPVAPVVPPTPPKPKPWPVKTVEPNAGALLPFNRIVAYYGNFYSTKMGVLGEYAPDIMISKLNTEVAAWTAADPLTPVIPAIDYIAVTAQGSAGTDGKYRARMPFDQIDHAVDLAKKVNGIVILDIQVGLSDVQTEIPLLEKYLKMPQVHLALDPEFAMQTSGKKPGKVIGTLDAVDINFVANYLAKLVRDNNLTPKILIVHRFTNNMVTNYKKIIPLPEVQIVMDMDGWGFPAKKLSTYQQVVYREPVQFTGFKLFYKNDLRAPSTRIITPDELMKYSPRPIFIQYQ